MKPNREAKKRKYYRKCGDCGKRFEQLLMIRTKRSINGWLCTDCYVDRQIAEYHEYDDFGEE